jgi:hypothetical protein
MSIRRAVSWIVLGILTIIGTLIVAPFLPAEAGYRYVTRCDEFGWHCQKKRIYVASKKKRHRIPERDRWDRDDDDRWDGVNFYADPRGRPTSFKCEDKVRGLGTQWIGTEGALDAAKKDWMEKVRYDFGESYLDMGNAKQFISRCGRVSIGETMGQVMYRCEIVARPCKGIFVDTPATTK